MDNRSSIFWAEIKYQTDMLEATSIAKVTLIKFWERGRAFDSTGSYKKANGREWGAPYFTHSKPKKDKYVLWVALEI